ncbi:MAG: MBL fold metallo-hydrolase, partial [Pseudomonadota bacterium]
AGATFRPSGHVFDQPLTQERTMSSTQLSRRGFTAGLCGTGLISSAGFAADRADAQTGSIRITALSDGHFDLTPTAFSGQVTGSPAALRALSALGASVLIGANVWLVQTPTRRILVDTGSGATLQAKYPHTGRLPEALVATGTDPGSITDIVITHMHADHIGGLMRDGRRAFPSARLHIAEGEWAYWTAPDRPSQVPARLRPLAQLIQGIAGTLTYETTLHAGKVDLGEGVWLAPAPGHTPGHIAVRIETGGQQVLLLGDALISDAIQFAHPEVTYGLDSDPEGAAVTRRRLFDMVTADGIALAATHLNTQALIGLTRRGSGFRPHLV